MFQQVHNDYEFLFRAESSLFMPLVINKASPAVIIFFKQEENLKTVEVSSVNKRKYAGGINNVSIFFV